MSTEPITGLTYQEAGSRQTDALQNAELNYFAFWMNCVVKSVGATAPPGSPSEGDCHIVGEGASGPWAGHDKEGVVYRSGWQFYAPKEGVPVKDRATGDDYEYVSGAWTVKTGGGITDGDKGDITVSAGGTVWSIDAGVVTYAKMQDVSASSRVLARATSGAGDVEECTLSQVLDMVGSAADGDILYRASGSWTRLPVGTNGHVLTLASGLPGWAAGGGGSPGGADTHVQFNDGGAFGGNAGLTYNKTTNALTLAGALSTAKAADLARAATTNIWASEGNFLHLTGTTAITSFGSNTAGMWRIVRFAGAGTLTHNATSLILPTGANITTAANDCALIVGEGGSNARVVTYQRANGQALSGGGGGLTRFTESIDTASPNATIPVVRLLATNAATNVDVAVSPKGNGSFSLRPPSASMGKLGRYAVDLSLDNYATSWAATGDYSFSAGIGGRASGLYASTPGGYENTASGQAAFAIGQSNTASGHYGSAAIGRNNTASGDTAVALGMYHTADGVYSACIGGDRAKARGIASAFASGFWNYQRQRMFLGLYAQTSDATPTVANANSSSTSASNQLALPNDSVYGVTVLVTARHASSGACAVWEVKVAAKRGASAATTAIIGTPSVTPIGVDAGASAWVVAVSADTSIGCIRFTVTGEAGKTIEWTVETYSAQAAF